MAKKVELDQVDLLLLYFLQQDSRMSLSDLGKKIDMTPAAVSYRLNKLIDQNIIKKFSIVVNHDILTPNYSSYYVKITRQSKNSKQKLIKELNNSTYFDKLIEIAHSSSIIGITFPLSTENLNDLNDLLSNKMIREFSVIPILDDHSISSTDIVGENISRVYCPLCQKSISGEGIVTKIGDKHLSFCCRECKNQFSENYKNIQNNPN